MRFGGWIKSGNDAARGPSLKISVAVQENLEHNPRSSCKFLRGASYGSLLSASRAISTPSCSKLKSKDIETDILVSR